MHMGTVRTLLMYTLGIVFATFLGANCYAILNYRNSMGIYDPRLLSTEQVTQRLNNRRNLSEGEKKERNKYAVIVNGSVRKVFQENVSEAHKSLRHLGFSEDNIFLLTSNYPRDSDYEGSITARGTSENLGKVIDYLADSVDSNDLVLVSTTGHGERRENDSTLRLADREISAYELKEKVQQIKAGYYVTFSAQCFSGGMVDAFSKLERSVVAMSSTDSQHPTDPSFGILFWRSFRNSEADTNNDGVTSWREAFDYASVNRSKFGFWHKYFGADKGGQFYSSEH